MDTLYVASGGRGRGGGVIQKTNGESTGERVNRRVVMVSGKKGFHSGGDAESLLYSGWIIGNEMQINWCVGFASITPKLRVLDVLCAFSYHMNFLLVGQLTSRLIFSFISFLPFVY